MPPTAMKPVGRTASVVVALRLPIVPVIETVCIVAGEVTGAATPGLVASFPICTMVVSDEDQATGPVVRLPLSPPAAKRACALGETRDWSGNVTGRGNISSLVKLGLLKLPGS